MSKPTGIVRFPEKVKDALLNNNLDRLIERLEDEKYMMGELEQHFKELSKQNTDIPEELDWIYAQYNIVSVEIGGIF